MSASEPPTSDRDPADQDPDNRDRDTGDRDTVDRDSGVPSIESLRLGEAPFVLANALGEVLEMNAPFREVYGWSTAELVGRPLSLILPGAFQMAHQLGFSRFQSSGRSEILGHPLRLRTVCRDGREVVSEHFIVAERSGETWVFGATLTPLPDGTPVDA